MNNKFIATTILLFLLLFTSCIKEVTPDLGETEKQLVVNSFIINNDNIRVTVTESLKPGEIFDLVEFVDAEVALFEDDIFLEILNYETFEGAAVGYFTSNFSSPSSNKEYKVIVDQDGFDQASASASIPSDPELSNASVNFIGDNAYPFSFSINNNPIAEYYYLKMFISLDSMVLENSGFDFSETSVVEIPEGAIPNGQRYLDNGYIFTDEFFNEGINSINGIAKAAITPNSNIFSEYDQVKFHIHLESLSEEAYKFYSSHAANLISETDFLTESIPVYGNIENGLGIFAGIYVSEISFDVE